MLHIIVPQSVSSNAKHNRSLTKHYPLPGFWNKPSTLVGWRFRNVKPEQCASWSPRVITMHQATWKAQCQCLMNSGNLFRCRCTFGMPSALRYMLHGSRKCLEVKRPTLQCFCQDCLPRSSPILKAFLIALQRCADRDHPGRHFHSSCPLNLQDALLSSISSRP